MHAGTPLTALAARALPAIAAPAAVAPVVQDAGALAHARAGCAEVNWPLGFCQGARTSRPSLGWPRRPRSKGAQCRGEATRAVLHILAAPWAFELQVTWAPYCMAGQRPDFHPAFLHVYRDSLFRAGRARSSAYCYYHGHMLFKKWKGCHWQKEGLESGCPGCVCSYRGQCQPGVLWVS